MDASPCADGPDVEDVMRVIKCIATDSIQANSACRRRIIQPGRQRSVLSVVIYDFGAIVSSSCDRLNFSFYRRVDVFLMR